jgi:hypothetical protein
MIILILFGIYSQNIYLLSIEISDYYSISNYYSITLIYTHHVILNTTMNQIHSHMVYEFVNLPLPQLYSMLECSFEAIEYSQINFLLTDYLLKNMFLAPTLIHSHRLLRQYQSGYYLLYIQIILDHKSSNLLHKSLM